MEPEDQETNKLWIWERKEAGTKELGEVEKQKTI